MFDDLLYLPGNMAQRQREKELTRAVRASKRKKPAVNYYESGSELEEPQTPPQKKQKRIPKQRVFPFLKLPPEIRNTIYELVLSDPAGVHLNRTMIGHRNTVERVRSGDITIKDPFRARNYRNRNSRDRPDDRVPETKQIVALVPSLLAVNKQIYCEAVMVLYGNDFTVADTFTLHTFITNLGPRCASYLKHITLVNWASDRSTARGYNNSCFAALVSATNLKRLTFLGRVRVGLSGPYHSAKEIYRNASPWLEAVGMAKGETYAAVDMLEVSMSNLLYYSESKVQDEERDNRKREEFKGFLRGFLQDHMQRIRSYPRKRIKTTT